jgi:hypothetical protein
MAPQLDGYFKQYALPELRSNNLMGYLVLTSL